MAPGLPAGRRRLRPETHALNCRCQSTEPVTQVAALFKFKFGWRQICAKQTGAASPELTRETNKIDGHNRIGHLLSHSTGHTFGPPSASAITRPHSWHFRKRLTWPCELGRRLKICPGQFVALVRNYNVHSICRPAAGSRVRQAPSSPPADIRASRKLVTNSASGVGQTNSLSLSRRLRFLLLVSFAQTVRLFVRAQKLTETSTKLVGDEKCPTISLEMENSCQTRERLAAPR